MTRLLAGIACAACALLAPASVAQMQAVALPADELHITASPYGVDAYKAEVARLVTQLNAASLADSLPPILKSVVVLDITVAADGTPERVVVWRSNGYTELERAAVASVRNAGRLTPPPAHLLGDARSLRFLETWLFRPDGRFQVRSVVGEQLPDAAMLVVEHERSR
jgi:TonB family protein